MCRNSADSKAVPKLSAVPVLHSFPFHQQQGEEDRDEETPDLCWPLKCKRLAAFLSGIQGFRTLKHLSMM